MKGSHADAKVALEYWDDVKALAFSTRIEPVPTKLLLATTHAHAPALASMSVVLGLRLLATRFPGLLRHGFFAAAGLALLADLPAWWLARESSAFVSMILVAGAVHSAATAMTLVLVVAELWLPPRR